MAQLTMSDDSQAAIRNPIWDVLRRSRVSSREKNHELEKSSFRELLRSTDIQVLQIGENSKITFCIKKILDWIIIRSQKTSRDSSLDNIFQDKVYIFSKR